jgi:hypothetical protein
VVSNFKNARVLTMKKTKSKKFKSENIAIFRKNEELLAEKLKSFKLEWIPSFEGYLAYNPDEIKKDKIPNFYRVFANKGLYRIVRLHPAVVYNDCIFQSRAQYKVIINGKMTYLKRYQLVHLCSIGFPVADPNKYVIDHIDENSMNDKPSNLRVITRVDNLRTNVNKALKRLSYESKVKYRNELKAFAERREKELRKKYEWAMVADIFFKLTCDINEFRLDLIKRLQQEELTQMKSKVC